MTHKTDNGADRPVGGVKLPDRLRRDLAPMPMGVDHPLIRRIMQLKALHPQVQLQFRAAQLQAMDEPTLKYLLEDLQSQLAID